MMRSTVKPAQLIPKRDEDTMNLMTVQGKAASPSTSTNEQRSILLCKVASEITDP